MSTKERRRQLLERKRELLLQEQERAKKPAVGLRGVGKDIYKGAANIYPALAEMIQSLPSELMGAGKQLFTDPERTGQNVIGGAALGLHGALSTPGNIRDYLVGKELVSPESPSFRLPESWMPKEFDPNEATGMQGHQPGDEFLQGIGSYLPYAPLGEAGALGPMARMGTRSGTQSLHAVGQNQNPVTAAGMVPNLELPLHLANAARPSRLFRGNLPAEELQANMRAAEGTQTGLGDVIGSPTLKQLFENVTTKWPGSGADELLGNMARQVENRAENLLERSGEGLAPGERNAQLKGALETAYENQRNQKNALYEPVNELAQQEAFTLELPSFRDRARQQLDEIATSPLMRYDLDFRNLFNRLSGLEQGATRGPSILEANMLADKLYNEGQKLLGSPTGADRHIGGLYQNLAERTRNDIRNELRTNGSPELRAAYDEATRNYRENFSQFLDKDLYRLTRPDIEAESIINDVIKPGKQGDKFSRIEKIQNALPPEQRNILGNAWLRNALDKEGTLNAKQFAQLINKLGPRQFEALFPDPQYRQQLLDYGRLRGMNEKALSRMANPNTGQQLAAPMMIGSQIGGVSAAIAAGNPFAALGYGLGPQVGSRIANHFLTNPATRNNFINQMLENELNQGNQRRNILPSLLAAQAKKDPFLETENYEVY